MTKKATWGATACLRPSALVAMTVLSACSSEEAPDASRLLRGEELAAVYCVACHLELSPDILPKQSWEAALGYMGYWLGIEDVDYLDNHPPFTKANVTSRRVVLERENVLPSEAAISADDWAALRYYFTESAPTEALPQQNKPELNWQLPQFNVVETDYPIARALTTLVRIREGSGEIYLGDGYAQSLSILNGDGQLVKGPVTSGQDLSPIDIEFIGDAAYIGSIGDLFASQPSAARSGHIDVVDQSAETLEIDNMTPVIDNIFRMADMNVLDLNGDGSLDFITSGFGAIFGNVSWYESQADGSFVEHVLISLPGAVKTEPYDFNGDGLLDIMVLLSDAREGLHILENQGDNEFELRTIFEKHPAFGHSYFELHDFNADGAMDVLVVNGDNVDSDPYNTNKNYHGIRIYLNRGDYIFDEAYFYPMYGALFAKAADFDEDGDLDIAATSFYPDFSSLSRESFTYLENLGDLTFAPYTNGQVMRGRWMTMDVGDVDGDGDVDVVLGGGYADTGLIAYPELAQELADTGPSVLILKNNRR
jgi:hypothetical protein